MSAFNPDQVDTATTHSGERPLYRLSDILRQKVYLYRKDPIWALHQPYDKYHFFFHFMSMVAIENIIYFTEK